MNIKNIPATIPPATSINTPEISRKVTGGSGICTMTLHFLCITLSSRSICQPRVPPAPRHPRAVLEGLGRGTQRNRAGAAGWEPAVVGRKVMGCWVCEQAPVGWARGTGCARRCRHGVLGAALSTRADPVPGGCRILLLVHWEGQPCSELSALSSASCHPPGSGRVGAIS